MRQKCVLTYSVDGKRWTHDASGRSFFGWEEGNAESFEQVAAVARKTLLVFYKAQPGKSDLTEADLDLAWGAGPARVQTETQSAKIHNLFVPQPTLDHDADPTAGNSPLLKHTSGRGGRNSVA
jgi:hypothetical protein